MKARNTGTTVPFTDTYSFENVVDEQAFRNVDSSQLRDAVGHQVQFNQTLVLLECAAHGGRAVIPNPVHHQVEVLESVVLLHHLRDEHRALQPEVVPAEVEDAQVLVVHERVAEPARAFELEVVVT